MFVETVPRLKVTPKTFTKKGFDSLAFKFLQNPKPEQMKN